MDVLTYLNQQRRQMGRLTRKIKDSRVFDFAWVPPEPIMRGECKQLIDAAVQFQVTHIPTHLAIIGSRGSGKTLTVKYLQSILPEQLGIEILYANCRHHNTSYRILGHLTGEPYAGASLSDLYQRFTQRFGGPTIVVLDEVDLMSTKDKRREILYLLSRSDTPYQVVLLSNSPQVLKQLDAATRSSLQPVPLHFRNYDAQQVHDILLDRARRGLHEWDGGALRKIAALTTQLTNADARVAIKTLYYTVTHPHIDVETSMQRARHEIIFDLINDLTDGNLMILWAAATCRTDLAREIYRRYSENSHRQHQKPFSYVHFLSMLGYMQSMGIIALSSTKHGRTYTNRVLLTFEPSIVESICKLRFE